MLLMRLLPREDAARDGRPSHDFRNGLPHWKMGTGGAIVTLPFVVALCPTYRRPDCLQNSIACFEAQEYPAHRRYMLILDDSGELAPCSGSRWHLSVRKQRFHSLPQKYNWLAGLAGYADVFFIWEDDDVFGPQHICSHVDAYAKHHAIGTAAWCKPRFNWTTHPDAKGNSPNREVSDGRMHSSVSFTKEMFGAVNGWPITDGLNFDQQFMSLMGKVCKPLDPATEPPQYVFRWQDTGHYHGQAYGDAFWASAQEITKPQYRDHIEPKFDQSTIRLYRELFGKEVS